MTIKELSVSINYSEKYLYQIICGYRKPSLNLAMKIEQETSGEITRLQLLYPDNTSPNYTNKPDNHKKQYQKRKKMKEF